jgi:RNA polymerase sigma-70 factor (ECF subfamily)
MAVIAKIEQEPSDELLAAEAQKGDNEAFGKLVRRYEDRLLRYASRLLVSSDLEPADVVQEAFIKAYVNLRSFDSGRRFSPWIYRIVHNELINSVRQKAREMVDFYDFDSFIPRLPSSRSSETEVDRKMLREQLDACLGKLPKNYREPLVLFAFEGMSYAEIGEVLHLPAGTVGVRISRGKKKLRESCQKMRE